MKRIVHKKLIILVLCIFNFTFIYGCTKDKETIKIGILGTMSGINSDLSVSGRRGIEIAVDEVNSSKGLLGKEVELVIKDDENDFTRAIQMEKEFINENIPVVIGPYTSGMIVSSMDYLKDKNILFLGPTISADNLSGKDDNFIRFIASTKEQAVVLTETAKKNNHKKFAVIYDVGNRGYNDALYNNFISLLEKNGGQVIFVKGFNSNNNESFSNLTKDIISSKAEALFIIANADNNAAITQQLRKTGSNIQIYSPLWSNTAELIKKGGSAVENMLIVGGIDPDDSSEKYLRFKKAYLEKYGENPTFSSVYSYETAKALFETVEKGKSLDPSTIKNSIIKTSNFKGLQKDFKIDNFGDNTREYMIFRIENGELRKVNK